jgi:hypothetical protein
MKKAGDLLSYFFDEKSLTKVQGYSKLFTSWVAILKAYKIPAAGDHSRIVELERHVLLIEADHPGWIQILQTKQRELLSQFQHRFPDLAITGISFRLSREPISLGTESPAEDTETNDGASQTREAASEEPVDQEKKQPEGKSIHPYDIIKDDDFRDTLKRLEQEIALKNKTVPAQAKRKKAETS